MSFKKIFNYSLFLMVANMIICSTVYAFDWEKCKESSFYSVLIYIGGGLYSTTQWSSSWGECSMIGLSPKDRPKSFIAKNADKLLIESAKGNGEYLTSFSKLASCDAFTSQKLPDRLQNKLKQIYGDDLQSSAEEVYNRISELVRADKELSCKYLGS